MLSPLDVHDVFDRIHTSRDPTLTTHVETGFRTLLPIQRDRSRT